MKSPKGSFWRDLFVGFVVVVVLWRTAYGAEKKTTAVVNVGVVLDLSSWAGKMSLSCINMALSDFNASHPQLNATIVLHVVDSEDDLVLTANRGIDIYIYVCVCRRCISVYIFNFVSNKNIISIFDLI